MGYDIKPDKEHFRVYINGEFYCTADTRNEAESEIKTYFSERGLHLATAQN